MRDREIVALLCSGDQVQARRGLEAAYATYADRIHDYARSMLRTADPDAAADVTHDTFLVALGKASGLRDPDRLRSWLYAIARHECLRVLRTTRRRDPLDDTDLPADTEGSAEMTADLARSDLRELVHAAAEGLSPKDREVFELGMRHDLDAHEIASALGVSDNAAHALLSRVRAQFTRSLGALSVARTGRGSCPALDELLAAWDGSFDALWRKRIARHVESCAVCSTVQARELSPSALLGLFPFVAAPAFEELFEDDLDLVSGSRSLADRVGPFELEGFPGAGSRRRRPALLALLGVFLLLGVVITTGWMTRAEPVRRQLSVAARPTLASASPLPTYSLAPGGTLTLKPTPTVTETPTPSATPTVVVTPSAPPPTTAAPTTSAPTTSTPTPPPPPPVGTLSVKPTSCTVPRTAGGTCTTQVVAVGGPVDWTATRRGAAVDWTTVSPASGSLAGGESATVVISVAQVTDPTAPSELVVEFDPGNIFFTITLA